MDQLKAEPLPELLRQLAAETTTLVRQEIELAKVELGDKAKAAGRSAGLFGGAAICGLGAFGAGTAAIIAALSLALPVWCAALLVAIVYGIAGAILAARGRRGLAHAVPVVPQQTTQTVKEDVEWIKTRAHSGRK
jgi:hypothetical protein